MTAFERYIGDVISGNDTKVSETGLIMSMFHYLHKDVGIGSNLEKRIAELYTKEFKDGDNPAELLERCYKAAKNENPISETQAK